MHHILMINFKKHVFVLNAGKTQNEETHKDFTNVSSVISFIVFFLKL